MQLAANVRRLPPMFRWVFNFVRVLCINLTATSCRISCFLSPHISTFIFSFDHFPRGICRPAGKYYYDRGYDENSRFVHVKLLCVCVVSMQSMTLLDLRWLQHAKICVFQCTKNGIPNARGKCVKAAPHALVSA